MRSGAKKTFFYHADANALGGVIETPSPQIIPSQSSVSLPHVGGHAATRTEAFNFHEIVSCRSAYTRVAGRAHGKDGPWSVLVTSVVEGLNILEVVKAERIVAQISIDHPNDDSGARFSLAGSQFEGLQLGGHDAFPRLNRTLTDIGRQEDASQAGIQYATFQQTGKDQAGTLLKGLSCEPSSGTYDWLVERFAWMNPECAARRGAERTAEKAGFALCSLVEGIGEVPGRSFGHVVEIPDFGRVFLGELLVSHQSIQIAMIRAELGCTVGGNVTCGTGGASGRTVPP